MWTCTYWYQYRVSFTWLFL